MATFKAQCFRFISWGSWTKNCIRYRESGQCVTCVMKLCSIWSSVTEDAVSNSVRVTAPLSVIHSTHLLKPSLRFTSLESPKNRIVAFRWTRLLPINVSLDGNFRGVKDRSHPFQHQTLAHLVQCGPSRILSLHFQLLHINNILTLRPCYRLFHKCIHQLHFCCL
jgi:hypothetical protein